eukprot:scaffold26675_cov182-Skeletonema_menzelii.AAC.3
MTEAAPPKRRRLSAANTKHQNVRCISDLPSGILAHAASFLAAPSKALFAIALDADSAVLPKGARPSLEFEEEAAKKLTDSDIERVLLCIDAVDSVKRLKLANCTNITGTCLEPLRGSFIIEQIDLSLVGDSQSTKLDPEPPISCDHVLPILDSIIAGEGCALKHLQFPHVWRKKQLQGSDFQALIRRYNQMWGNREEVKCLQCNTTLPQFRAGDPQARAGEWISPESYSFQRYGVQLNTCYGCFKHFCYRCRDDDTNLIGCSKCKRDYCNDCKDIVEMDSCGICSSHNCCYEYVCHECGCEICTDCALQHCSICVECDKAVCLECYGGDDRHDCQDMATSVTICDECEETHCNPCRFRSYRQEELSCAGCFNKIGHLLVDDIKQLRQEVELLKAENKELKLENKDLRSRK